MTASTPADPIDRNLTRLADLVHLGTIAFAAALARAHWASIFVEALSRHDSELAAIAAGEYAHFDRVMRAAEPPG